MISNYLQKFAGNPQNNLQLVQDTNNTSNYNCQREPEWSSYVMIPLLNLNLRLSELHEMWCFSR